MIAVAMLPTSERVADDEDLGLGGAAAQAVGHVVARGHADGQEHGVGRELDPLRGLRVAADHGGVGHLFESAVQMDGDLELLHQRHELHGDAARPKP